MPAAAFISAVVVRWRHRAYFVLLDRRRSRALGRGQSVQQSFSSRRAVEMGDDRHNRRARHEIDRQGVTPSASRHGHASRSWGERTGQKRPPRRARVGRGSDRSRLRGEPGRVQRDDGGRQLHPAVAPSYVPHRRDERLERRSPEGTGPAATRVLAIPGENFAAYRFGDTIDTVYPALLTRPFVQREQQEYGSLATQDVLYAFDDPIQEGYFVPSGLAPMASLMSAGDVLVQNDLAYERYDQPTPAARSNRTAPRRPTVSATRPATGPRNRTCRSSPRPTRSRRRIARPALAVAARGVPGRTTRARSCAPRRRPPLSSSTATQRGSRPPPTSGCSRAIRPCSTPPTSTANPVQIQQAAVNRCDARPHRHRPQAGVPLELRGTERRVHRDRDRDAGLRPDRGARSTSSCRRRADSQTVTVFEGVQVGRRRPTTGTTSSSCPRTGRRWPSTATPRPPGRPRRSPTRSASGGRSTSTTRSPPTRSTCCRS